MYNMDEPWLLVVDDDQSSLDLLHRFLSLENYNIVTAQGGQEALAILSRLKPDLVLLDVMMPGMDGYQVCEELQKNPETAYIPVIFVSALEDEQNRARAFSVGAVDYLIKPVNRQTLLSLVENHLETGARFAKTRDKIMVSPAPDSHQGEAVSLGEFFSDSLGLKGAARQTVLSAKPTDIYRALASLEIDSAMTARLIAQYRNLEYLPLVDPDSLCLGLLPVPFCRANNVIVIKGQQGPLTVLSNPCDFIVMDSLAAVLEPGFIENMAVTEPETIEDLLSKGPAEYYTDRIVSSAVFYDASDIGLEIGSEGGHVQLRFNGVPRELLKVKPSLYPMLISRFKILANMNIAERRRPQTGAFSSRGARLRLTTSPVAGGENMAIRLLPPLKGNLRELALPDYMSPLLEEIVNRRQGIMIFAGTPGSGRTTTICTMLNSIQDRSVVTIEDPIEYDLPKATQQQVNARAGLTIEQLLKGASRQRPDILYISELLDEQAAIQLPDLAARGTMISAALLASDTAAALSRLENMGLSRRTMAEHLQSVLAQRLLPRLCPLCKKTVPLSPGEAKTLADFTHSPPPHLALAIGCASCNSGYSGRIAVFELLVIDEQMASLIRGGRPFNALRHQMRVQGQPLLSQQGMDLLARGECAFGDIWEHILKDETLAMKHRETTDVPKLSVLVVDDDPDIRTLLGRHMEGEGWQVSMARDGVEALLALGRASYDLIIADVDMPNLDGIRLMELNQEKGINTPVIFVSAYDSSETAAKCRQLGAAGYLVKPVVRESLLNLARQVTGSGI